LGAIPQNPAKLRSGLSTFEKERERKREREKEHHADGMTFGSKYA